MIRKILSAIVFSSAALCCMPAYAQNQANVHVKFGDLKLTTVAGAKTFYQRLEMALTDVCGEFDAQDSVRTGSTNACRDQTRLIIGRMARQAIATAQQRAMLASAEGGTKAR